MKMVRKGSEDEKETRRTAVYPCGVRLDREVRNTTGENERGVEVEGSGRVWGFVDLGISVARSPLCETQVRRRSELETARGAGRDAAEDKDTGAEMERGWLGVVPRVEGSRGGGRDGRRARMRERRGAVRDGKQWPRAARGGGKRRGKNTRNVAFGRGGGEEGGAGRAGRRKKGAERGGRGLSWRVGEKRERRAGVAGWSERACQGGGWRSGWRRGERRRGKGGKGGGHRAKGAARGAAEAGVGEGAGAEWRGQERETEPEWSVKNEAKKAEQGRV